MYFKNFPSILYPLESGQLDQIKDIITRVGFSEDSKINANTFVKYYVEEGQTPEKIAEEVYGDQQYHWIVLLFNDLEDPIYDFPMRSKSLDDFIDKKYPSKTLFLCPVGLTQEFYSHYDSSTSPNFEEGDTITTFISRNNYKDIGDDAVIGVVKKFIPELSCIQLHSLAGDINVGDIIARGYKGEIRAQVRRINDSRYAVHHFEEDSNYLNPLATPPDSNEKQVPLGMTGDGYSVPVGTTQTILENYINDNFNDYVITNEEHEFRVNESRKTLNLLNPILAENVIRDLRKILNR